jgi:outer membrane protein OmpA-like peptidoglycan-associated protein
MVRLIFLLPVLITAISCMTLRAQNDPPATEGSKRAQKAYQDALELRQGKELTKAVAKLEDVVRSEPQYVEAAMKLAEWHFIDGHLADAARAFEYTIAVDSLLKPRTLYSLGRIYLQIGEYTRARVLLQRFLAEGSPDKQLKANAELYCEKAQVAEEFVSHPVLFEPEPIPGFVNTSDGESLPAFTIDGNFMLFTRKRNGQEDLFISTWDPTTKGWSTPESLKVVNTLENEGANAVAADGSMIAFMACGRSDGAGSCDLYFWQRKDGVWQRPVNAGGINSPVWDGHPALTPDGNGVYFSSERPGGLGGKDIWYTERHGDRWTRPMNLGSPINTPGNEESPFLYYDGRTLYFMSDGHPGLGDTDLYVSTREGSEWSAPKNLGYPINTHRHEGALAIHPNREYAYYTSDMLNGQHDIYRFKLDSTLLPPAVSNLRGRVIDASTKAPLLAQIAIFQLSDSTSHFGYTTDADGNFSAVLVHGKTFGVHATAKEYAFWSGQFALDMDSPYTHKKIQIELIPVKQETVMNASPIVLRNIEFETGSAQLLSSSLSELQQLLRMLNDNPEVRIEIRGHTDNVGDKEENRILSEARAAAVYDWLLGKGVHASRLSSRGFGEKMPIASNDNEEGRQTNRRVEFVSIRS